MAEVIASLERLKVSSSPSAPCAKLLDTSKGVAEALDSLKNSEEVFVDLEGLDLCRHGTITLLSVLSNDGERSKTIETESGRGVSIQKFFEVEKIGNF